MSRIVFSLAALADLQKISDDIADNNGTRTAAKYLVKLRQSLEVLAEFPYAGRLRPQLGHKLRSWPHRPYVAIYVPETDGIRIVRIVHGRRKITRRLVAGEN